MHCFSSVFKFYPTVSVAFSEDMFVHLCGSEWTSFPRMHVLAKRSICEPYAGDLFAEGNEFTKST